MELSQPVAAKTFSMTFTSRLNKFFRSGQEDKLQNRLTSQGSFFANITKFSLSQLTKIWSASQSNLPPKYI